MIEEGININEQESFFKRNNNISLGRENKKLKRIDFLDRRVYKRDEGVYYPSVTSILSALPADPFFLQWLSDVGKNADIIRDKAAREGTQLHESIEKLLKGEAIEWVDEYGNARYNLTVWKMLLKFQNFYEFVEPETLATEMFLYSDKYRYAGTTDYLCRVRDETWLLDWKSSNHCGISYFLQLAAYAKALEERQGIKVDRCGVVWLKASTRSQKFDLKRGVCQGEGWQILFVDDIDKYFNIFLHVYEIYKALNPKVEPYTVSYPTEISLNTSDSGE